MKKIFVLMMVLAMVLITAQAVTSDTLRMVLRTDAINAETQALQEEADKLFKGVQIINAKTIELKGVSTGEAKYTETIEQEQSWFEKAIDWVTFWN